MYVRLAGVPASYTVATDVIVVDANDHHYLVGGPEHVVTPLTSAETMLVMGFYEPVQSHQWHDIESVARALRGVTAAAVHEAPVLNVLPPMRRMTG
ncbi:MAG: hypothetical protein M9890_09935 [Thermomicrobiales bacterium]|nr:hypothetical protein [Thermomicrobiales bacterium]